MTGASRGLGRAIALALAEAGADVAVAARSKKDLEETAQGVARAGRRALVVPTDVARYEEVEALMTRARSELGRLDIVVNNAGVAKVAPLLEMTPADWRFRIEPLQVIACGGYPPRSHSSIIRNGTIIGIGSVELTVYNRVGRESL